MNLSDDQKKLLATDLDKATKLAHAFDVLLAGHDFKVCAFTVGILLGKMRTAQPEITAACEQIINEIKMDKVIQTPPSKLVRV